LLSIVAIVLPAQPRLSVSRRVVLAGRVEQLIAYANRPRIAEPGWPHKAGTRAKLQTQDREPHTARPVAVPRRSDDHATEEGAGDNPSVAEPPSATRERKKPMLKRWTTVIAALLGLAITASAAVASGGLSGAYKAKITKPASIKGVWEIKSPQAATRSS
jgi:hypothetical protein